MIALDTNILIRLLTNDDPAQALRAQAALNAELAAGGKVIVSQIVLCEMVWVLTRVYGYSLAQCQLALDALLAFPALTFEGLAAVVSARQFWQSEGGDFADHMIGAAMQVQGCRGVLTFDKKAAKSLTHFLVP